MYLIVIVFSLSFSLKGQALLVREEFSDAAKNLSVEKYKTTYKKELRKLNRQSKPDAFPIYWMVYTGDSSAVSVISSHRVNDIFSNLSFTLLQQSDPSLKDTIRQTVFSSLIFDSRNDSLLAKLSEDKNIYRPSLPDKTLFRVAKEVGAKQILHIMNLFDNWPYFIIDRDNKILVHEQFIGKGENNYTYRTLPIEDFFSSNENVITFRKSDWLTWR